MRFVTLALLLLAGACVTGIMSKPSVTLTRLSAVAPAPHPADYPVSIFRETRPRCAFEEVALAKAQGGDPNALAEALRVKARDIGGDAIIGFSEESVVTGARTGIGFSEESVLRTSTVSSGTIIRYKDRSCTE